jgi:vacuole morphology and inheritance protein 14
MFSQDIVTESETFDIESFIPLLQKHIKRTKPYIRQLLVGWISILNAVPDINMLDYLPEFLDGLFNMLSDGNREIRQGADNVLGDFLREIKQTEVVEFGPMVNILVRIMCCCDPINAPL